MDGRATGSRTISLCPPNRMGGGGGGLPSSPRLLHHASHDTRGGSAQRWVKRQRGRERGGSAGQREFFDRQTESGGVGRDRGRKSEGNTGPDAFLIDGPKNLCEGRLLCFDVALIGRRGSKPNPDWEGGRWEAADAPGIHHGGGAAAGRAVDLRGPTGDPENELTISITHKGRDGETLLEILFRGGKEEPTKRDLAPARLEKQRMMLFCGCGWM